jgi:hypothetical protein
MGSFLFDAFFKSFLSTVNMFISIFMIQILQNLNILVIMAELYLPGNTKKIAKFLMRTFTCSSTFFYAAYSPRQFLFGNSEADPGAENVPVEDRLGRPLAVLSCLFSVLLRILQEAENIC